MSIKRITAKQLVYLKLMVHLSSLCPVGFIYYQAFTGQLGADPVEAIIHFTGIGAFNLLLLSLLVSPLAKYSRQGMLIRLRRPIGLYAFAYAVCHLANYLLFDLQLQWSLFISEIITRPYITVGFSALLILSLLAATSTQASQKRLGKTWQKLHNGVYLSIVLVSGHYLWAVKADLLQPLIYASFVLLILIMRRDKLLRWIKHNNKERIKNK